MKNKKTLYFPLLLSFTLGLISCGNLSSAIFNSGDNIGNEVNSSLSNNEENEVNKEIKIQKISFSKSTYKIKVGDELKIDVTIFPSTAKGKVTLECSNSDLIKVDNDLWYVC